LSDPDTAERFAWLRDRFGGDVEEFHEGFDAMTIEEQCELAFHLRDQRQLLERALIRARQGGSATTPEPAFSGPANGGRPEDAGGGA